MDTPWPLRDVLAKLIEAADHLLSTHGCDAHGHEEVRTAMLRGRDYLTEMRQVETAEPRKHEQAMRLLRKYLDRECNPFEPNNQSATYKELAAFLYPTSPEEPRETSARDILQRLVDTCELATGAPWPALDEARAFLSGSPEEPSRELSPSEAASFAQTLARSPRRVEPTRISLDGLKSWGLSPGLPPCSLVITFESVAAAIAARKQIGTRFGFPMHAENGDGE